MSAAIAALLTVIAQIAPTIGVPAVVQTIINTLVSLLPTIVKEVQDVAPLVQNIIDALRGNAVITPEQLKALEDLEVRLDAEFEAAAAMPDDEGMPSNATP